MIRGAALVLVLMLAGCTADYVEGKPAKAIIFYDLGNGTAAKEFLLEDATRCVIVDGHGISCDWPRRVIEVGKCEQ